MVRIDLAPGQSRVYLQKSRPISDRNRIDSEDGVGLVAAAAVSEPAGDLLGRGLLGR